MVKLLPLTSILKPHIPPLEMSLLKNCKHCVTQDNTLYCRPELCCKYYTVLPEKGPIYKVEEENTALFTMKAPYFVVVSMAFRYPMFTRYDECGAIIPTNETKVVGPIITNGTHDQT